MNRLNFGCGSVQPVGWINLDSDPQFGASYTSLRQLPDDHFDVVAAHCALQVNTYNELPGVLAELHRIIRPGGSLRLSLPDVELGFRAWDEGAIDWFPNGEDNIDDRFCNWLTWYSTARVVLNVDAMLNLLERSPFQSADAVEFGQGVGAELDDREQECFFVEAIA